MRRSLWGTTALGLTVLFLALATSSSAIDLWRPEIKLLGSIRLEGSFVSAGAIYADAERIFAGSYQGDLFVLERDRQSNFPTIQVIKLGSPLSVVRGNDSDVYVTSTDGNLYQFAKTWPLRFVKSVPLAYYGLSALEVVGSDVYVGKGQAAMAASSSRLFLSQLNAGDSGVKVPSMETYGEEFVANATLVFDRTSLKQIGTIPSATGINLRTWQDFLYMTTPGCCGAGIDVYDARRLTRVQFISRSANTVAGTRKKGTSLIVAGSESGVVDLYTVAARGHELASSADLRSITGFTGPEDVEIRALWVDGLDGLVFAASSWGNDLTRSPQLPSLFILEIR
jgi:hypothetical protein